MSQSYLQTNCFENNWNGKISYAFGHFLINIRVDAYKSKGDPKKLTIFRYKANH